jgi:feruloyl esterase
MWKTSSSRVSLGIATLGIMGAGLHFAVSPVLADDPGGNEHELAARCTPEAVQALAPVGVTVKAIKNGTFKGATQFVAAKGIRPAFCQVVGSFVTNPKTGKSANFLATFPENWNGKYLQLGCSGHCGQFFVSNPALPTIAVTAQGYGSQIIDKGYASIATDEGHEGMAAASWALRKDGSVDPDYVDDFLYRAHLVLSDLGKKFTSSFYAKRPDATAPISRSYFSGCSGGGRDAMVAASYFPEKFDGIIAGSPYNPLGVTVQGVGLGVHKQQIPNGNYTPALAAMVDSIVKQQCDASDGVADGLIQNPAACNFRADRDLPVCQADQTGPQCFTKAQVKTVSLFLNAVRDEKGNVIQPGFSVSELQSATGSAGGMLSTEALKIFVHGNDPKFAAADYVKFKLGRQSGYHTTVSTKEVAAIKAALIRGYGHMPEKAAGLLKGKTKFLMWHNWSDEQLTPYNSINFYNALAKRHGGFAKLQQKARLFMIPGSSHCSISGVAPGSFDAIGALENWVEKDDAPQALTANVAFRDFTPGAPKAAALNFPNWTQKLCAFPAVARYSGKGDVQDAANWSCPADDRRGLIVGESGHLAGMMK